MRCGALITIFAVSVAAATRPTGKLPAKSVPVLDDLHRITLAAYRDKRKRLLDSFAPDTTGPPMFGKPFKMAIPFSGRGTSSDGHGSAFYDYKDGQILLGLFTTDIERGRKQVIFGPDRTLSSSSFLGQNAYGAKARVVSKESLSQGIALMSGPRGEEMSAYDGIGKSLDAHDYWFRSRLDGPAAKALVADTDLIVEGTFAPLENGKAADCSATTTDATITNPTEGLFFRCYAGANVTRVAFVRRSTGQPLKEWTGEPVP